MLPEGWKGGHESFHLASDPSYVAAATPNVVVVVVAAAAAATFAAVEPAPASICRQNRLNYWKI